MNGVAVGFTVGKGIGANVGGLEIGANVLFTVGFSVELCVSSGSTKVAIHV